MVLIYLFKTSSLQAINNQDKILSPFNEFNANIKNYNQKLVIINKLKQLLEENSNLQHSIDKHYYADHVLFDKVKFQY